MDARSIYQNIAPLDHRYSLSDPALFARLSAILGEEASIRYCARVEVALLKALLRHLPSQDVPAGPEERLDSAAEEILPEEVYAEEAKTHHNVRALVNVLKRHLP